MPSDAASAWAVGANQFFGIDIKPFAVELAKVTLMLAKKLALDENEARVKAGERHASLYQTEKALPLDNLNANIPCYHETVCDKMKAEVQLRSCYWVAPKALPPFLRAA